MIKIRNRLAASLMAVLAGSLLGTGAVAQDKLRISLDTNPSHVRNKGVDIFVAELKKRIEFEAIGRALRASNGNITRAAERLGMKRPRLSQIIHAIPALSDLKREVGET